MLAIDNLSKRFDISCEQALVERGFRSLAGAVSYAHRPPDPVFEEDDLDFISE